MSQDFIEIIRREAANVFAQLQMKSTLVATSYDPKKHAVKGILMPHGVESDWISIGAIHIGNRFGVLVGPNCGSKEKLDGDQFDIEFERGDPHNPIAKHRLFSVPDQPPEVQSGEILVQHEKGHKFFMAKDGSVTIFHAAKGGVMAFDPIGNLTHDVKDAVASTLASLIRKVAPTTIVTGIVHLATGGA